MLTPSSQTITSLLRAWTDGDQAALERLVPRINAELHRLARHYMRQEKRPGHLLETTALVNEAYVRLIDWKNASWQNRAHFFGVAAQLMRRILVDIARSCPPVEKANEAQGVSLDEARIVSPLQGTQLVALDDALNALDEIDPRKSRVVELRFFAGLSVDETAEVLKVAPITVMRDWKLAKVWLLREMKRTTKGEKRKVAREHG